MSRSALRLRPTSAEAMKTINEPQDYPNPSYGYLWASVVALAIVAGSIMATGRNDDTEGLQTFADTPNGLSGHLHQAMSNVMSIQADSDGRPFCSNAGDTLFFKKTTPGQPDSMQLVRVYVDNVKGGLWAHYGYGESDLLAPAVDRMMIRTDESVSGKSLILELSATLLTPEGEGPRRNLHVVMSNEENG